MLQRCSASAAHKLLLKATPLNSNRRWLSQRLRNEEHRDHTMERLSLIGGDKVTEPLQKRKTVIDVLSERPLQEVSPGDIFRTNDIPNLLETPAELVNMLISRAGKQTVSDKWIARFLMTMYQATKHLDFAVVPAKIAAQTVKTFMKPDVPFEVDTASLNALLTIMYNEHVDTRTLYEVYNSYKTHSIRPNHQTLALMFNVSLRAHRMKNAENFFLACEKLLVKKDFSYTAKTEIIASVILGISDSSSAPYAERLIRLLHDQCFQNNMAPQSLPEKIDERRGEHLYLSKFVAEHCFWGVSRLRSMELVNMMEEWDTFLANREARTDISQVNFMRLLTTNAVYVKAFEIWENLAKRAQAGKFSAAHEKHLKNACIALLEQCSRARSPVLMERSREMVDQMINLKLLSSARDRVDLYVMQIKLHTMSNEYDKAKELYHKVKRDCTDTRIFRTLCTGRFAKENLDTLREIYFDFKALVDSTNNVHNINMEEALNKLLGVLADCGELQEVMELMEAHAKQGNRVTLDLIHQVLVACARDKDASSYGTFFRWSEGGQDTLPLYFSHLKNTKTTAKNCQVAQGIFDKLPSYGLQPTTRTYSHLMAVYAASRDYDEVARIYNKLKEDGTLQPDQMSFYYAAKALAEKGHVDRVEGVFTELLTNAKEGKDVVFSPEFCAMAIRALANTGVRVETIAYTRSFTPGEEELDWLDDQPSKMHVTKQPRKAEVDMGFRLLDSLKELGLRPTIQVYTSLLGLCTRAGDYKRAEDVYNLLKSDDTDYFYDHSDIITNLMKMHYTRDSMEDAMSLFQEVTRPDSGARLDTTGYHNCLATCASKGSITNAKHVLNVMFEDQRVQVTDTAISLAVLSCAHYKPEDVEEEVDLVSKAKEIIRDYRNLHKLHRDRVPLVNTQQVFHQLLHVCATCKQPEEVVSIIKEMKDLNVVVDKLTLSYYARSLSRPSQFNGFWEDMKRCNLEPDTSIVYSLLSCCQTTKDPQAAINIISKYMHLCNEKLQLLFYRIFESARLSREESEDMELQFREAFGKSFADMRSLAKSRAIEQAEEAASMEKEQEPEAEDFSEHFEDDEDESNESLLNF